MERESGECGESVWRESVGERVGRMWGECGERVWRETHSLCTIPTLSPQSPHFLSPHSLSLNFLSTLTLSPHILPLFLFLHTIYHSFSFHTLPPSHSLHIHPFLHTLTHSLHSFMTNLQFEGSDTCKKNPYTGCVYFAMLLPSYIQETPNKVFYWLDIVIHA